MIGFRDTAGKIALIDRSLHMPRLMLERSGVPPAVIDDVYREMADAGVITMRVERVLRPYLRDEQEREVLLQAISDDGIDYWDRTVLVFDETTWEELGMIDDGDLVSADVFDFLPYPNPFVMFPEPIELPQTEQRVYGMYVYGLRPPERGSLFVREEGDLLRVCSTDDPRRVSLAFRFAGFNTDAEGNPAMYRALWDPSVEVADSVFTTCLLAFARPVMSVGEIAEAVRRLFSYWADPRRGLSPADTTAKAAEDGVALMRIGLAAVLYLCCSNADLEVRRAAKPVRKARKAARKDGDAKRELKVVMAGFQLGAQLRLWRTERESQAAGQPTGRRLKPHRRRSHMHRFRYGPQRSLLSQPRFMPSTWVNARERDPDTVIVKPVSST